MKVINLWGIPDNLPVANLLIVAPKFYLQNFWKIENSLILVANVFVRRFVLWGIMVIIEGL